MQELRDSKFDICITRTLKAESTVSLAQMQRARKSLYRRAAQQAMLPPASPSLMERLINRLGVWTRISANSFYLFVTDDAAYRRAQHSESGFSRHCYPLRIFASTEFMLFA
jgi:hypothetical protein